MERLDCYVDQACAMNLNWSRSDIEKGAEDRHAVVVSRHWDNPNIEINVTREKIELVCSLADFVSALQSEMPHPMKVWTKGRHKREITAAMLRAVEKIKEASSRVM